MRHFLLAALLVVPLAGAAWAANHQHDQGHGHSMSAPAGASDVVNGEIRRVDKEARKLTIRHEPLANLDMPAMTMVFQVADPALLDKVKQGDKIRFRAAKVNGAFTVMGLE